MKKILILIVLLFSFGLGATDNPIRMQYYDHDDGYRYMRIINETQRRLFCTVTNKYNGYTLYTFYADGTWWDAVNQEWVIGTSDWMLNPTVDFTWRCN